MVNENINVIITIINEIINMSKHGSSVSAKDRQTKSQLLYFDNLNWNSSRFLSLCLLFSSDKLLVGRDSSVVIATRYGLDGSEIESRWGARFSAPRPDRAWGPTNPLHNRYRVFRGVKAVETWCWAIHLLTLWAFMNSYRVKFTFKVMQGRPILYCSMLGRYAPSW